MVEISVVIPTYNRERLVGEAIASALGQDVDSEVEVVVADDGSSDATVAVARSFGDRVRVLESAENRGGAAARNEGIRAARGEFIALLDSDDVMLPGRLQAQAEFLRARPDVGVVTGACHDESGEPAETYFRARGLEIPPDEWLVLDDPLPRVLRGFFANSSTTTARRSVLLEAGLYDERYYNTDLEILIRLARITRFACLNRPLAWIRSPEPTRVTPPSEGRLLGMHDLWRSVLREGAELAPADRSLVQWKLERTLIHTFGSTYLTHGTAALRRSLDVYGDDVSAAVRRKWRAIARIPRPLGHALVRAKGSLVNRQVSR